jgi:hypothetical protein
MSAVQALGAARAFGIHLELDGDDLLLEASGPPPDAVLDALSRHKPEVVRLLHSAKDGSSPEYWHILFHQRAAFAEFAGELPRADAEAQAFECCIVEWLNRNPTPSAAGVGYTRNAGQRGRNSVDLRRKRLSLEWALVFMDVCRLSGDRSRPPKKHRCTREFQHVQRNERGRMARNPQTRGTKNRSRDRRGHLALRADTRPLWG